MFRACISSGSRAVASTSSFLHTSAVLNASKSKKTGLRIKKLNISKTAKRLEEAEHNKPSVVLGTRAHEEAEKWKNCDLSKVLVNEEELFSSTEMKPEAMSIGTVQLPKQFGYGVDEVEKEMLFESLPVASADMTMLNLDPPSKFPEGEYALQYQKELRKANLLAKALDLRNANAAGIAFENRRRIIQEFSTPANPFDPGRTEVQVALLTYRIRNLWTHLTTFKRDVGNRRALRQLVHQRAKLLRYLKGVSRDRYETILDRLALEPESVEGELVV
ncbi:hypothetical protein BDZ97DRAFT_1905284 [Flammula alnicola]|nr:hypothetical protein BDZ97DRAFT_1905284 [Flammula alnicola]